jgi:hypothetical protein
MPIVLPQRASNITVLLIDILLFHSIVSRFLIENPVFIWTAMVHTVLASITDSYLELICPCKYLIYRRVFSMILFKKIENTVDAAQVEEDQQEVKYFLLLVKRGALPLLKICLFVLSSRCYSDQLYRTGWSYCF